MRSLLQEWILKGVMPPHCKGCTHFLAGNEPRVVRQPVVAPSAILYRGRFTDSFRNDPVCDGCFYHDDGTPSNYNPITTDT